MSAAFTAEDEALLARLSAEVAFARLFRDLAGPDARAPHPRASGLLVRLAESPDGARAVARALDGDVADLATLVAPARFAGLAPVLLHHLALFHGAVAAARPLPEPGAPSHHLLALAAWLALAEEGSYLVELARRVADGTLDDLEVTALVHDAVLSPLDALAEVARAGAAEHDATSRRAIALLARAPEAVSRAGCSEPLARRAERHAARLRLAAVDRALAALEARLDEVTARGEPGEEHLWRVADGVRCWSWSGQEAHVEHFLVDRALPMAWELHGKKRWDDLRRLAESLAAPMESLAARIARDPAEMAYASRCAQIFVFRAELDGRFERQLEHAERAVALCPTHRNGRLVLADLLCVRAIRTLDSLGVFRPRPLLERAAADVERAASLWPELSRLAEAGEKLSRARGGP